MRLAIIPARGGSKRIPRKNVRPFCGKPIIVWSVEAALRSGCFDKVLVSTDDAEIAAIALQHGADVPFMRPAELSGDHVATIAVVAHAIEQVAKQGEVSDPVCCIYATAPFVTAQDLRHGLDVLARADCDYVFPATRYPFPIQRAVRLDPDGHVAMFEPAMFNTRSQDLEEAWHDAGQFYWGRADAWRTGRPIFGPASVALRMPRHRVQDIDTPDDWLRAEWMFRAMQAENGETGNTSEP